MYQALSSEAWLVATLTPHVGQVDLPHCQGLRVRVFEGWCFVQQWHTVQLAVYHELGVEWYLHCYVSAPLPLQDFGS
jgi:hypothetical protein